ncbi:MAG: alpha-glucan family phosphorylase [Proteobacteria bacterium]|nr:alpha-glucan family phosphorylase [Pseudomonadota bacterium]MBU1739267.1 alpha-glucan family phosphorylase [Pseudomonadota bacterium]
MKKTSTALIDKDQVLQDMLATNSYGTFFGVSQKVLDQVWKNLTSPDIDSAVYISMEIAADRDTFHPVKSRLQDLDITGSTNRLLDSFTNKFLYGPEKIPNYGGGLGVLSGDTLKSFADCKIPVIAVSLLYRKGYFSQMVDSKVGQISWSRNWAPEDTPGIYLLHKAGSPDKPLEIEVPFYNHDDQLVMTYARLWLKMEINHRLDFFVPQILLDYSCPNSPEWIKNAAQNLYDSSSEKMKITQRRMLGAGVIPTMKALGIHSQTIHLNEQHGVAVILTQIVDHLCEKLGKNYHEKATDQDILDAAKTVAEDIVYTIHTPVKAGHDRFHKDLHRAVGHSFCQRILQLMAQDGDRSSEFNFTTLAMKVNRATNSVSRLHKDVTCRQFPEFADKISAITNGVHHLTWISDAKAELYDSFTELDGWRDDPGVFENAFKLKDNKRFRSFLERSWQTDNRTLIGYVNEMLVRHRNQMQETWIDPPNFLSHITGPGTSLEPGVFTIGFARRFSTYKRADLIFEDIEKLVEPLLANNWPVNFIFAGKAHPSDEPGKALIKMILDCQQELFEKSKGLVKLVFIPGYDMAIAKMMVAGVHAWLNSPKRPLEASGTSGMKSAMNGIPNISIMDGWWAEGYHDGKTGWKFGYEDDIEHGSLSEDRQEMLYEEDSNAFYRLFPEILTTFYHPEHFPKFIDKCIMNIALNCPIFNTHRMIAEYLDRYQLKIPAPLTRKLEKLKKNYCSDESYCNKP